MPEELEPKFFLKLASVETIMPRLVSLELADEQNENNSTAVVKSFDGLWCPMNTRSNLGSFAKEQIDWKIL